MLYLGVDPSLSHTGLALIDEKLALVDTCALSTPTSGVERLYHLENLFGVFVTKYAPNIRYCAIESGAYRETGRLYDLGEWAGVLKLYLFKLGISFIPVAPLQLKKYISGVGKNKGKDIVILDIYKNYNLEIRDSDIADAFVLSVIARDFYLKLHSKKKLALPKYQEEVLKAINKNYQVKSMI